MCFQWQPPTDNGGVNGVGYAVYRAVPGSSRDACDAVNNTDCQHVVSTSNVTLSYCHNGRAPSTTYGYRVAAMNPVGTGQVSNVAEFTTTIATVPSAPGQPALDTATSASLEFHWGPPADSGGLAITEYDVEYRKLGQGKAAHVFATSWASIPLQPHVC